MNIIRTRIARFTVASALVLGMGALGVGPALATGTWAGSVPASTMSAGEDAATDAQRGEIAGHGSDSGTDKVRDNSPDLAW